LGTGLITTALKRGKASAAHVNAAIYSMLQLNKWASEISLQFAVDAMTDITGFGLLGHASEVAKASHVTIEIDHRRLPLIDGALDYSRGGFCAGGLTSNREFYSAQVNIRDGVSAEYQDVIYDPQTSGGLLIFSAEDTANALLAALKREHIEAAEVGVAREASDYLVVVS
jgi:selenide,water dikinase